MAVTAMKSCRRAAPCRGLCFMKGPFPCAVPQTDIAAITNVAIPAPNARKRIAAQMTNGNARNAKTSSFIPGPRRPPKIAKHVASRLSNSTNDSIILTLLKDLVSARPVKNNGVTISTPIASPSHQIRHVEVKPDHARMCVKRRVVAPTEAATMGAIAAPKAISPRTSRNRSKEGLSLMKRRTR